MIIQQNVRNRTKNTQIRNVRAILLGLLIAIVVVLQTVEPPGGLLDVVAERDLAGLRLDSLSGWLPLLQA